MRKFKALILCGIVISLLFVFGTNVFASTIFSMKVSGTILYGDVDNAEVNCWVALSCDDMQVYADITGAGPVGDHVYKMAVDDSVKRSIQTGWQTGKASEPQYYTIVYFVCETPSAGVCPNLSAEFYRNNSSDVGVQTAVSTNYYYFDIDGGDEDLLDMKSNSLTAADFITSLETEITNANCTTSMSGTLGLGDYLVAKIVFGGAGHYTNVIYVINYTLYTLNGDRWWCLDDLTLSLYVSYSLYNNKKYFSTTTWTKCEGNTKYVANATKVETNDVSALEGYLTNADATTGNANITYGVDDYIYAPVYRHIDLVNIDINTGEIVGKLSDLDYDFEWYGGTVTLDSGTTLASGRTLTQSETFTVDVYTYYPDMYIRRWEEDNKQWISISEVSFTGAVLVNAWYTATFTATIFNPDKTVATNSYGVIPRSYAYDFCGVAQGSVQYLQTYYGYSSNDQDGNDVTTASRADVTQATALTWCSNLTKKWEDYATANPSYSSYVFADLCQGDNWKTFVYQILYLVKYANRKTFETIAYGNMSSYTNYSGLTTFTNVLGDSINLDANSKYFEAIKGGDTIGLCNGLTVNDANMCYGYQSNYDDGNGKLGLYQHQFLTYNTGSKRVLLDGYVGSDQYTSMMCLGQCNSWGNAWQMYFGVVNNSSSVYVNFNNYDYLESNYLTSWSAISELTTAGYTQLGYSLPGSDLCFGYADVDSGGSNNSLILLPSSASRRSTTSSSKTRYFFYYYRSGNAYTALIHGGTADFTDTATYWKGLFALSDSQSLNTASSVSATRAACTFRTALV